MRRAVILGGTGVLGRAIALRLAVSGWSVTVMGRDVVNMPAELTSIGVRFVAGDRRNADDLARVIAPGADLLVDAVCFTAEDARQLVPHLPDAASAVMLSSKAVYVDAVGNHVNSDTPPRFSGPIDESNPTVKPTNTTDYMSREGYGASKVAAELELLSTGYPVSIVRASKVHGAGASRPREWVFVRRILDRRPAVFLTQAGSGTDHTTAAVNTAALVETIADNPGARVLNSADPDALNALEISRVICRYLGYQWEEILLDDSAPSGLGSHPWESELPIVLNTQASLDLGYRPVGSYAETIPQEIDWLLANPQYRPDSADQFFASFLDYEQEDRALAAK